MSTLAVLGGHDATGAELDVYIVSGIISEVPVPEMPTIDATGLLVAPGLLDLQVNGAAGVDVTAEPERLAEVGSELVRHGVTAYLPTVITSSPQARAAAFEALRHEQASATGRAVPLGLHLEGPMISPARRGAHPIRWLQEPSLELIDSWTRADVAMVTIAPELPGALEVIAELDRRGVVVSMGHTAASTTEVADAIAVGASCVTHLYNAMPPLTAREPGPIGAALGSSVLTVGMIVDGVHLEPYAVRTAWRALGPDRIWCVSDATAALGLGDGPIRLGDQDVVARAGAVRLSDGTLAGSASSLTDCVRNLWVTVGCSVDEALATATSTPARLVGDVRGTLRRGAPGDVVLLDVDDGCGRFDIIATVVGGIVAFDARTEG